MFAQMPSIFISIFALRTLPLAPCPSHLAPRPSPLSKEVIRASGPPFSLHLELELGSPPVTPLGVVSDRVSGPHSDPLRNGPILLLLLSQHFLNLQRLVRRHLLIFLNGSI